jgi:hypothetical protein
MKFKKLLFLFGISVSCFSFSQNKISQNVELSPLTEVMILKNYSSEEIKNLSVDENKLKMMEYFYSKSFEIAPNQNYTNEQYLKIDVNNFRLQRKKDEDVIIFDEISGLNILLYSLTKVELGKKSVNPNYIMNSEKAKKSIN